MREPLPEKLTVDWSFLHRAFYQLVKFIIPRFTRMFFDFEVNGLEYIKQFHEGTPVIFCSNHRSHLDTFLFASAAVKPFGNRTTCGLMGSGKVMSKNKFYSLVKYLGAFPIYIDNPEPALEFAMRYLRRKLAVFLAPQGKRILSTPYHDFFNFLKEGKSGIGRLVLLTNCKVPVIPMYIHGSAEALRQGQLIPKFKAFVSVSFCEPLFFNQFRRKNGWKINDPDFYSTARTIVNIIMQSIKEKMLVQERYYFKVLELKFGTSIENIKVATQYKNKFNEILFKLLTFHPSQLEDLSNKML